MEAARCPSTAEQMKKEWHIYNEILLSHEREQNSATCSNMDGPRDAPAKSVRERQTPYDLTFTWNLKYDADEPVTDL